MCVTKTSFNALLKGQNISQKHNFCLDRIGNSILHYVMLEIRWKVFVETLDVFKVT